jgi:hypothetical protein
VLTNAERSARRREQVAPFLEPDDVVVGTFLMERADVAARQTAAVVERLPEGGALGPVVGPLQGQITFRDVVYDVPLVCVDEARRLLGSA